MFGKNKSGQDVDLSKTESLIGQGTVFQGTISSKGTIRVDGKVEGGISESLSIVVGEEGEVHGDITGNVVVIAGKVVGNIIANTSLEILANSQIHGDVKTAALTISEGAIFEGNCQMTKDKHVIQMDVKQAATAGGKR